MINCYLFDISWSDLFILLMINNAYCLVYSNNCLFLSFCWLISFCFVSNFFIFSYNSDSYLYSDIYVFYFDYILNLYYSISLTISSYKVLYLLNYDLLWMISCLILFIKFISSFIRNSNDFMSYSIYNTSYWFYD